MKRIDELREKIKLQREKYDASYLTMIQFDESIKRKESDFRAELRLMREIAEKNLFEWKHNLTAKEKLEEKCRLLCIKHRIDCSPCIFCANFFLKSQLRNIPNYDFSHLPKDINPEDIKGCFACVDQFLKDNTPKSKMKANEIVCVELLPSCKNCGIKICREGGCENVTCIKCKTENHIYVEWQSHPSKSSIWLNALSTANPGIIIILYSIFFISPLLAILACFYHILWNWEPSWPMLVFSINLSIIFLSFARLVFFDTPNFVDFLFHLLLSIIIFYAISNLIFT
jgi:hypothetical protein